MSCTQLALRTADQGLIPGILYGPEHHQEWFLTLGRDIGADVSVDGLTLSILLSNSALQQHEI